MATTIPDLWSDDIKVDVLTPVAILRSQESFLGRKTQGILRAQVRTTSTEEWIQHQLDLIAPAFNQYRKTLLTARQRKDDVYPVIVRAECFAPQGPTSPSLEGIKLQLAPDERKAATQEEFIDLVRQVLQSAEVRSLIQSLIARSNEARLAEGAQGKGGNGEEARRNEPEASPGDTKGS